VKIKCYTRHLAAKACKPHHRVRSDGRQTITHACTGSAAATRYDSSTSMAIACIDQILPLRHPRLSRIFIPTVRPASAVHKKRVCLPAPCSCSLPTRRPEASGSVSYAPFGAPKTHNRPLNNTTGTGKARHEPNNHTGIPDNRRPHAPALALSDQAPT